MRNGACRRSTGGRPNPDAIISGLGREHGNAIDPTTRKAVQRPNKPPGSPTDVEVRVKLLVFVRPTSTVDPSENDTGEGPKTFASSTGGTCIRHDMHWGTNRSDHLCERAGTDRALALDSWWLDWTIAGLSGARAVPAGGTAVPSLREMRCEEMAVLGVAFDGDPTTRARVRFRGCCDCVVVRVEVFIDGRTVGHGNSVAIHPLTIRCRDRAGKRDARPTNTVSAMLGK